MRRLVDLEKGKDLSLIVFDKSCLHFDFYIPRFYFGLGYGKSRRLVRYFGFAPGNSIAGFESFTLANLEVFLRKNFIIEKNLLGVYLGNVNKLKVVKSYRGFRHRYGLPVNGQSSKNNSVNCSKTNRYLRVLYDKKYRLYRDKMILLTKLNPLLAGKFLDE